MDTEVTIYKYTKEGYIKSVTDQNGHKYTENIYDEEGRVIGQNYPNGDKSVGEYDRKNKTNKFY
jgi:hypothetical protein